MASTNTVFNGLPTVPGNAENVPTTCVLCSHNCGMRVDVKDNTIVAVRSDKSSPSTRGYSCNKGYAIPHYVHHKQRVETPLKRRPDGSFEEISWDQAISEIADKLNHIRHHYAPRAIGLAGIGGQGNHANAFGATPFMYGIGSPTFFNALAQEKTQHALVDRRLFRGTPDLYMPGDEEFAEFALIIGTNPMISNRGVNATETLKAMIQDDNRQMVVVDPRVSDTARRADRHLRIKPGQDFYLLTAMAAIIVQEGLANEEFLRDKTRGYKQVKALLQSVDIDDMTKRCELERADIELTAREYANASRACISYDLGIEQCPNSTLASYLIRVLALLTGNVGQRGGNPFVQLFGPKQPFVSSWAKALESGIEAIPMFLPMASFSPNLIPEEILSAHPDRIRALIVDGANPLVSYADTSRFREAFEKLDLLVVIEPAMTETARAADYVLPTPTGYEKWEMSIFPKDTVTLQLRPPVVNGPSQALPEIEIYYRLARAMGIMGAAPKILKRLATKARTGLGAPAYLAALTSLSAARGGKPGRIIARTGFWLYETLGPTLPNPMLSIIWLLSQGYALTRRDQVNRALPLARKMRNPANVGELVFSELLAHPEGVTVGLLDEENNFDVYCNYRDGKARMYQKDFADDILRQLSSPHDQGDTDYPLVLNGGMRTGWSANTIVRDPSWRKGKGPHAYLLISKEDAAAHGVENGAMVKLSTRRGAVTVPCKIDPHSRPGHVHLPNIFDLRYPDPDTGELRSTGVTINELTDASDRDPYTGIPNFKRVRCKVELVAPETAVSVA